METSKVTSKYQITIPKSIRERMKLRIGDKIIFDIRNGEIFMKKAGKELKPSETLDCSLKDLEIDAVELQHMITKLIASKRLMDLE
ncbi:MAG: AbrB/MazE/SpoVT family DNA-binding domain-containing protein [Candidatus Hydrothermarchaeota archaeon]